MTRLENKAEKGYKNALAGWNHGPISRQIYVMDECKDVFLVKKTIAKSIRNAWLSSKQHRQILGDFLSTNHSVVFVAARISNHDLWWH